MNYLTIIYIVTFFSGQKRDLPFSESRTKYAFIVDSAIRPPPFWQKILWTTLLKRTYVANTYTYFKLLFLLLLKNVERKDEKKGFIYRYDQIEWLDRSLQHTLPRI